MENKRIEISELKNFCIEAMKARGMDPKDAETVAEVLTRTDALGIHSHGTKNLHNYMRKIEAGGMELSTHPTILKEGEAFALVDANNCIGMVSGQFGIELAIEKAKKCGVSFVVVKNSEHFGAAGYYSLYAAEKGMIAISMSNVDANMSVPGSKGKVIGNNPVSYAVPAGKYPPVFLDIALSSVASLKVIKARHQGTKIPTTWIVDKDGLPTDDPSHYPEEGAMQPMAAHKGYGLAFMVELLTGILAGAPFMTDIPSWLFVMPQPNNVSHTFICVDPAAFGDEQAFRNRVDEAIERLHNAPKAKGAEHIYYPGEIEWNNYADAEKSGINIPADVAEELVKLSQWTGVPIKWREER